MVFSFCFFGYRSINIDGENHTHLTMAGLSAVEPEGGCRVDGDLELRDFAARSLRHFITVTAAAAGPTGGGRGCRAAGGCSNWLETRPDASIRFAWISER